MMENIYSVQQVNGYIHNKISSDAILNKISVRGEVSNCKYHSSGHIYFTLKDNGGTLSAVMFAGNRRGLSFTMSEGMKVVVHGKIDVYERGGCYQLYAQSIEREGQGELYQRFAQLKAKLEEMGMFDSAYKRNIPRFAQKIGVVTAGEGAALHDIITVATRRNPHVKIVLYPAIVQGEYAPASIVRGIGILDQMDCDVLIVGRGGGSIEDLWAFNEEIVASAIFHAHTPIISAVGHETDTTIADFVADLRAPTPSAAAELATFEYAAFVQGMAGVSQRMEDAIRTKIDRIKNKLKQQEYRLAMCSPMSKVQGFRTKSKEMEQKLSYVMEKKISAKKQQLMMDAQRLKGLSPLEKLSSGYAFVTNEKYEHINSVQKVEREDVLTLHFADGSAKVKVMEVADE
jgi:hypothetical protein